MLEKMPDAVGHALHQQRAGLNDITINLAQPHVAAATIDVTSPAFHDNAPIPAQYTADGPGLSPPLAWNGVPAQAESLVLIVEDADAPAPHPLVHAIAVLPAQPEGSLPEDALNQPQQAAPLTIGRNSYLTASWLPPDPPPGHGVHRYAFQVFALSAGPVFSDKPGRDEVQHAIRQYAIASGYVIGTYERPDKAG
jgi:Raf kinase inhibitor-like YbhB/YbcL family protein